MRRICAIILLTLLAGCSHQVTLEESFPEPVISKLPATVVLYLPDELRNAVHKQKPEHGGEWTIRFRGANTQLFETVFRGLFQNLTVATDKDEIPEDALVITPTMTDFQFSTPGMSKTDFYEVWIKYRLELAQPKNRIVHTWPFTAYGRDEKSGKPASNAMREASRRAMRDAAAAIVLNYPKQKVVKKHLQASIGAVQ
ncbi:hypothetical protein [Litorivivens sp.]|uniref:hypothetical protein n=1 Tax=Litorivivens sp. TaxID=2020868 RepID=UPI003569A9B9